MRTRETALPLALVAAWIANDAEEWFTMAPWSAKNADAVASLPIRVPWPAEGMTSRQAHLAISAVGVGVAVAAVRGRVTGGKSPLFRAATLAFGLHGFAHVGQSIALRRYTPGVLTGAAVVIPFWWWARSVQRRSGTARHTWPQRCGAVAIIASLPGIVAAAGVVDRKLSERS